MLRQNALNTQSPPNAHAADGIIVGVRAVGPNAMTRLAALLALVFSLTACGPDTIGPTSSTGDDLVGDGDGDLEGDGDPSGDGDGDGLEPDMPDDMMPIPDMGSGDEETGEAMELCCSCGDGWCFEVPVGSCFNPQTGEPDQGWQGCDGSEEECLSTCECTCDCDRDGASAGCSEDEVSACNAGCGF